MKLKILILIYTLLLFNLEGCQIKDRKEYHNKSILSYIADFSGAIEHKKRLLLTEITQSIKYVQLETTQESQLNRISKIIASDSCFYISDQEKLLKFSYNGKFIRQIGKIGRGPGEYASVADFEIDNISKLIYLSDDQAWGFLIYDTEGTFIKKIEPQSGGSQFLLLGEDKIALYTTDYLFPSDTIIHDLLITDLNLNPKIKFQNHYIQKGKWTIARAPLYIFDKRLYFKENFNDTLYRLNNNKLEPYSIITLGEHQINPPLNLSELIKSSNEVSNKLRIYDIVESKRYLFTHLKYGYRFKPNNSLYVLYDKDKNLSTALNDEGFFNNIDQGVPFWPKFVFNEDIFIDYRDAFSFKSEIQTNGSQTLSQEGNKSINLKQLADNIKETDNPILIFVKLKQ